MLYHKTLNRDVLARCHRCEWTYEADDTEFPSRFLFQLVYDIDEGEPVLRAIEPTDVITTDLRGRPLFTHQLSAHERVGVWQWFHARWTLQQDQLLNEMQIEIELDRTRRNESTEATFQELACQQRGR